MPDKVIHEIRLNQYIALPADRTRRFSLGTKDSYGIEQLRIVPGEGWDGLTITATFHPPEGEAVQVIVPADGLIDVPPEATRSGSELPIKYGKIVFAGVADGVQRISCNLPYTVMGHAPVDGAASSGPSPSWYEQAAAHFVPSGGKAGQVLAKASDTDLDVEWADGGNGTADHAKLSNRDASDQHPISAITGLENALKGKQPAGDYLTQDDLQGAVNATLAQAKASGEFDGADGKSAYQYAVEGGYTGTEEAFAEKLAQEQLTGTTNDLTPTQVYDAVSAGIPVKVQYIDSTYGLLSFTAFNVAESLNVIVSQTIVYYNGVYILAELNGDKSDNAWGTAFATLAQKTDIPTALPNPNALTFTGAVTGNYDGSAPMEVEIPTVDDVLAALPTWNGGRY